MIVNFIRLKQTKANLKTILYNNPELFILSGFSPFIFEKVNTLKIKQHQLWSTNQLQIWRSGTILNGIYIGIVPAFALMISEYTRGITAIDLTPNHEIETKYASVSLNIFV